MVASRLRRVWSSLSSVTVEGSAPLTAGALGSSTTTVRAGLQAGSRSAARASPARTRRTSWTAQVRGSAAGFS
ncbi:MAG TPA: hypothetical protein VII13_13780 [Vicinamibacteria bacterium]